MRTPEQIQAFYNKWEEPELYGSWFGLWRKQYKFQAIGNHFLAINKKIPRLNFRKLKASAIKLTPLHIYASVLEYLRPDKVLSKTDTLNAYPVGGEFVIDIDAYMNYHKHRHKTEPEGICLGCLGHSADLTIKMLGLVEQNYEDIMVVFSGRHGFHIHVRDFDVTDWTYYDPGRPWKSHEVARRKYVELLKLYAPHAFDKSHYVLSCDVTRVITLPESLNGETGLVCKSYSPDQFRVKSMEEVYTESKRQMHLVSGLNWQVATEWKNPRYNVGIVR